MFKKFFRKKSDTVEFKQSQYVVFLNDISRSFPSKDGMLDFIEKYGNNNVIYSLSMFRVDTFNLIK